MARIIKKETELQKKIGQFLQYKRIHIGASRAKIAERINVTHQQIMKYENGTNGVSVRKLPSYLNALECDYMEFMKVIYDDKYNMVIGDKFNRLKASIMEIVNEIDEEEKLITIKNVAKTFRGIRGTNMRPNDENRNQ